MIPLRHAALLLSILCLPAQLAIAQPAAEADGHDSIVVPIFGTIVDRCGGAGLPAGILVTSPLTGDTLAITTTRLPGGTFEAEIRASQSMTLERRLPLRVTITASGFPVATHDLTVEPAMNPMPPLPFDHVFGDTPTIEAIGARERQTQPWRPIVPAFASASSGLTVHEIVTTEHVPLLTAVYFDSASSAISSRYHLYSRPAETVTFDESELPVDGLEAHRSILDVVGSRLRRFPATTIEVEGRHSEMSLPGETGATAIERAIRVRRYLSEIWGIDTARIRTTRSRDYPNYYMSARDPLRMIEGQRVEIRSNDWEIVRPVAITRVRRSAYPSSILFSVDDGVGHGLVVGRRLEIRRGAEIWSTLTEIDRIGRDIPLDLWERDHAAADIVATDDRLPRDTTPLHARLIIGRHDGVECGSEPFPIPVAIVRADDRRGRDSSLIIATLIQFKYDAPDPGPISERIIRELIPHIVAGSRVHVSGHTDITGMEDRNRRLSEIRAEAVAAMIRRQLPPGSSVTITAVGMGETVALYDNMQPAGRNLGRCVRVTIVRPE